jgi:hypothetical protein
MGSDRLEGIMVITAWMTLIPALFLVGIAIGISMLV